MYTDAYIIVYQNTLVNRLAKYSGLLGEIADFICLCRDSCDSTSR